MKNVGRRLGGLVGDEAEQVLANRGEFLQVQNRSFSNTEGFRVTDEQPQEDLLFFTWLAGPQFIPRDAVLGRIKFPNEFSKLDGIETTIQGSVHKRLQDSRCEIWAFLAKILK